MSSTTVHARARLGRLVGLLGCIVFPAGFAAAQSIAPQEDVMQLDAFVVTPSRFQLTADDPGFNWALTQDDLKVLPQVGEDAFRSISRLPGVTADDYTARFTVRGAPQRQVLVRLDGIELIEPFHLKDIDGALSIVDLVIVDRLDLMTGGFNVDYGNRSGAALTIETLSPTRVKPVISAGLSATSMRAGSLGTFDDRRGRWLMSVRRGYPELALRLQGRSQKISPGYWDAYGKLEYDFNARHTLSLHALRARDTMEVDDPGGPELRSSYDGDYVWARWRADWSGRLDSDTVLSHSWLAWRRDGSGQYTSGADLTVRERRTSAQTQLRQKWLYRGDDFVVRAGGNVSRGQADYDYRLVRGASGSGGVARTVDVDFAPGGSAGGLFAATRFMPWREFAVEPGVRFDRHDAARDRDWSPRLNVAWELAQRSTLRAAWGLFTQPQAWHELQVQFGETTFQPSEKAEHRVLSYDRRLRPGVLLRAEAYQRVTREPRAYWFSRYDSYDLFPEARGDRIWLQPVRGEARGLELSVQSRTRGYLEWSVSYVLSRAMEQIDGRAMPTARDQRHAVNVDATYRLGENWRFGAAWQYHTGWPITDVSFALAPGLNAGPGIMRTFGPTLGARLPDYHRLDLRVSRRIPTRLGEFNAFLDVFNAYDRANVIAFDYNPRIEGSALNLGRKPRKMLPLLPSVGVSWER